MILTSNGYEEDTKDLHHGKYSHSMAVYLDYKGSDHADDWNGDADLGEYGQLHGRRILWYDSQGFVDVDTYASVAEAREAWAAFAERIVEFLTDEDEDEDPRRAG